MQTRDAFLTDMYMNFRKILATLSPCTALQPYNWFIRPDAIRLDGKFGLQQMVYCDLADETSRDLANGINHLIELTMRLKSWELVIRPLGVDEKFYLLHEFIDDLAAMALLSPYTLKARFFFAIAHLSHQANCVLDGDSWEDTWEILPSDSGINEEVAIRLTKRWRSWRRLNRFLNTVDMQDYKKATGNFRNKHTHRFTPRVELGLTQMTKRLPSGNDGQICYGIGGSEPMKLSEVVAELKKQCASLSKCFGEFQKLANEQRAVLFGE
ncbi:hypothetical protein [Rhizobium gallicum]|uniref:hypothetical protein n=1 Tax=Rhizobium gallicum TaxID=56730 RepID=UPI001EF82C39|nr:hypothetical protein [Rhizobium gallicum]ULJ74504.1 hypothetical protein L2W42_21925 [Rhizobium gallicum]